MSVPPGLGNHDIGLPRLRIPAQPMVDRGNPFGGIWVVTNGAEVASSLFQATLGQQQVANPPPDNCIPGFPRDGLARRRLLLPLNQPHQGTLLVSAEAESIAPKGQDRTIHIAHDR